MQGRRGNVADRFGGLPIVLQASSCAQHRLVEIEEGSGSIRLAFDNGATVEADLVIGADGINSKVREFLLGTEPLRFVNAVAQRAIYPEALVAVLPPEFRRRYLLHSRDRKRGLVRIVPELRAWAMAMRSCKGRRSITAPTWLGGPACGISQSKPPGSNGWSKSM